MASKANEAPRVAIVGAGPAGIRAAETLYNAGLCPILLDEAADGGGQIYRQPPPARRRPYTQLYGFEAGKARALHDTLAALRPHIDYRPATAVWDLRGTRLFTQRDGITDVIDYDRLILATGAMDRMLPFEGWLTPGVYTLGAAQVALKAQAVFVGNPIVFLGSGPLLYLVASQYAAAGAQVAAVLDTASRADAIRALPLLLRQPALLAKGLAMIARLRMHGIPLRQAVTPLAVESGASGETVAALRWTQGGRPQRTPAHAVAFGWGLRSETQLADLAGCSFAFHPLDRQWLPRRSPEGRSSQPQIYLAGDGAGITGADAAELAGRLAAMAVLQDLGRPVDPQPMQRLTRRLASLATTRRGLERAFPFPARLAATISNDTMLCRCEDVRTGTLRAAVREHGACDLNRAKALTRVGMGRCQGRVCGTAAAEVLAQACDIGIDQVGRLRSQAPVKPLVFDRARLREALAALDGKPS